MSDNIPFTNLDFDTLKQSLKDYLSSNPQFRDFDFEGSNMAVLIDLLAYNAFQDAFYKNMVLSEAFLPNSQLFTSVISHAKTLNYLPRSKQSSRAVLGLTFNSSSSVVIPKGTRFKAQCGNKTFNYLTDNARITGTVKNGQTSITDLLVLEGRNVTEFFTVSPANPDNFELSNEDVDTSSIRVFVRSNSNPNSERIEYTFTNEIFGVNATSKVFYVESSVDGKYQVTFGKNVFGAQPVNGNVVEVQYRVTKGSEANGATNFTLVSSISGINPTVTNAVSSNGSDKESLEDIKFFAPKSLQIQERAVTESDYEILLKQRFPSIQTLSVIGGDKLIPPQYGKVLIAVDVLGSDGVSQSEIEDFRKYLRNKTPLTIDTIFVSAKFMKIKLDVNVTYNFRLTDKSEDELILIVKNAISSYNSKNLNKFNSTLRVSRLAEQIDESSPSFVSTQITANPIIEYLPEVSTVQNPSFDFNTALITPYQLNETLGYKNYVSALTSTPFILEGSEVTLIDNGLGRIDAITTNGMSIFRKSLGTVDYQSGIVRLLNFSVQSFTGNAIQIIVNTVNKDVIPPFDRILNVSLDDVTVKLTQV